MPDYWKIRTDVQKYSNVTNVRNFNVYVRQVPESNRPEDYPPYAYVGNTDTQGSFIWDRGIAGKWYQYSICAVDNNGTEISEAPFTKKFLCDPPAPTSVGNIKVELNGDTIKIKWDKSPTSEGVLKYEIRRVLNPGTAITWGEGLKIEETSDNQVETASFPFDLDFAILIAAWDGYKWSAIDEVWEGQIARPVTTGDVTTQGGANLGATSYPGTKTGWTTGGGQLTTTQTTQLSSYGALSTWGPLNGSGETGVNSNFDKYVYTTNVKDLGFATELSFRPTFSLASAKEFTLADWTFPLAFPQIPLPWMRTALPERTQTYLFADQSTLGGPPLTNIDLSGDTLAGVPLTMEIKYSTDAVNYTDWLPFPYGRELKVRAYQFRFTWVPYFPQWNITFSSLVLRVFRRNRKVVLNTLILAGGNTITFGEKFFQQPTVQVTSLLAGYAVWVTAINVDANGRYTSATFGAAKLVDQLPSVSVTVDAPATDSATAITSVTPELSDVFVQTVHAPTASANATANSLVPAAINVPVSIFVDGF